MAGESSIDEVSSNVVDLPVAESYVLFARLTHSDSVKSNLVHLLEYHTIANKL